MEGEKVRGLRLESPPNQRRVPWRSPPTPTQALPGQHRLWDQDHVLKQNLSSLRLWLLQGVS